MILRSRRKTLVSAFLLAVLLAMTYWAVVSASPASPQGEVPKDPVGTVLGTQEWFVKFDGIDGESRIDDGHEAWCDILSFSQAIHRPGTGTGATRRRGDVVLEGIVVSKEIDKCDPKLAESTLTGRIFPKVEIHLTAQYPDTGRLTYYAYELKNVQVVSYQIGGTTEQVPVSEVSLNFEEIKVTYTENDSAGRTKGNIEYTWNVENGEPSAVALPTPPKPTPKAGTPKPPGQ